MKGAVFQTGRKVSILVEKFVRPFCLVLLLPLAALLVAPLQTQSQIFSLDDGSVDAFYETMGYDALVLNHFDTGGRLLSIDQISVLWSPVATATRATVALYADPNGDGDPRDAVPILVFPIYISSDVVILNNGALQEYPIPATLVRGSFFVGAFLTSGAAGFPPQFGIDTSRYSPDQSWIMENTNGIGRLDLEAPAGTSTLVTTLDPLIHGNMMVRARYTVIPSCLGPAQGLVSWWPGDGSGQDLQSGNHGNAAGNIAYGSGEVRQAFVFDGTHRDRLDVGNPPSLQLQNFTIEGWVKRTSATDVSLDDQGEDGSQAGAGGMILSYGRDGFGFGMRDDGTMFLSKVDAAEVTATGAADTIWHHVAVTKSGSTVVFYLNGIRRNTAVFDAVFEFNTAIAIGSRGDALGGTFYGSIDELSIYGRALTDAQIRSIYDNGALGKCPPVQTSGPSIVSQPADETKPPGGVATLAVVADGTPPLSYQWFFRASPLIGATNNAFTLTNVKTSDAGGYFAVISNSVGTLTSTVATLSVSVLPPPVCLAAPDGVVAWWRAESNYMDSAANNDLLAQGTFRLPPYAPGKVGNAFSFYPDWLWFPPTTPPVVYALAPASSYLDVGSGAGLTIEGWVKPGNVTGVRSLLEWNDNHGDIGAGLFMNGTALEGYFTDTNSFPAFRPRLRSPPGLLSTSVWQHVALTLDRSNGVARLFVNGSVVVQTNLGPIRPLTACSVYVGYRPSGIYQGAGFSGRLDEITLYNRGLSPSEIAAIVSADSAGKCALPPSSCIPVLSDTVAWWRGELNLLDSVDSNNAIAIGAMRYTNGVAGKAFLLFTNYARVPASSNLDVGAGPGFTVEGWMMPEPGSSRPGGWGKVSHEFVSWQNGTSTNRVSIAFVENSLIISRGPPSIGWQANIADTQGRPHVLSGPSLLAVYDNWQHVALTYDKGSGAAVLYLNGTPVAQTNLGSFTPQTTGDFYIGSQALAGEPLLGRTLGGIDDLSLYERALSPDELQAIVLSRGAGKCRQPPVIVSQPVSVRVNQGDNATFTVAATGNPLLRYQWCRNGGTVPGATQSLLVLTNIQSGGTDQYSVRVTNAFGTAFSSNVLVLLNHAPIADASATRSPVIVPLHCSSVVILDGSRSSDPDSDPLNLTWLAFGQAIPLATGRVALVTLPLGTNSLMLVVDDGLATNVQNLMVEVITPAQAVDRLTRLVDTSVPRSQPLQASLAAAASAIARDNAIAAINEIQAFLHKVTTQIAPSAPGLALSLNSQAQSILDVLNRDCSGERPHGHVDRVARLSNGKIKLQFSASQGHAYLVQASTDLQHWETVGVAVEPAPGEFEFEDLPQPNSSGSFYRVTNAW